MVALLTHYATKFRARSRAAPTPTRQDQLALASLLNHHSPDVVRGAIDAMFEHGDSFVVKAGYPLRLFAKQFDRYVTQAAAVPVRPEPKPYDCLWPQQHQPPCRDYCECSQRRREEQDVAHPRNEVTQP